MKKHYYQPDRIHPDFFSLPDSEQDERIRKQNAKEDRERAEKLPGYEKNQREGKHIITGELLTGIDLLDNFGALIAGCVSDEGPKDELVGYKPEMVPEEHRGRIGDVEHHFEYRKRKRRSTVYQQLDQVKQEEIQVEVPVVEAEITYEPYAVEVEEDFDSVDPGQVNDDEEEGEWQPFSSLIPQGQ